MTPLNSIRPTTGNLIISFQSHSDMSSRNSVIRVLKLRMISLEELIGYLYEDKRIVKIPMPTSSKTQRQDPTSSIIVLLNPGSLSYPIEHYSQDFSKSRHCKCRWFCSCHVVGTLLRGAQEEESSSSTAKTPDHWNFASSAVRLFMAQVSGMEQAVWADIHFTVWSEYCDYARIL